MVTLPGSEGELGVYPKHVPLLTTLKPGELRVMKNGRETAMAIGEGFVEIKGDAVSVLTDMALESEKIDIAAAEAAVERAKAAMKEDQTPKKSPPFRRRCKKRWPSCTSNAAATANDCRGACVKRLSISNSVLGTATATRPRNNRRQRRLPAIARRCSA